MDRDKLRSLIATDEASEDCICILGVTRYTFLQKVMEESLSEITEWLEKTKQMNETHVPHLQRIIDTLDGLQKAEGILEICRMRLQKITEPETY